MLNSNRVLSYTDEDIIQHYQGTRWVPCGQKEVNHIVREQLLQLMEIKAFATYLKDKGKMADDGLVEKLGEAAKILEDYVRQKDVFLGRKAGSDV